MAKIFKDTIFMERELESAKIELCLKPDFNIGDAWRMIDKYEKGYLTHEDLLAFASEDLSELSLNRDDVYLFFRRYEQGGVGKIFIQDFSKAIVPLSKEYAGLLIGRQEFYSLRSKNTKDYFNLDTRNELRLLYKAIFANLKMTECLRLRISRRQNFSYRLAFEYADKNKDGYLESEDIKEMLSEHCFYATDREITSILNKFDKDGDGKVAFNEFIDEMSPKLKY